MSQDKNSELSGRKVFLYFLIFFLAIFIVNGIFVYIATDTHTGLVTKNAYEKGRDYNETIKLADEQNASGVKGQISFDGKKIFFWLKDKDNMPISAKVTAHIIRPTQDGYDYELAFESDKLGLYVAKANFPMKGQWEIRIIAKWPEDHQTQQYQQSKRIIVN